MEARQNEQSFDLAENVFKRKGIGIMSADIKVVFISMPWASIHEPSIALGILTSICREEAVSATSLYPNMDMSATIGDEYAFKMATDRHLFGLSEHLFACDLFDTKSLDSDVFVDDFAKKASAPFNDAAFIRRLRDEVVPTLLGKVLDRVLNENPTVVGLTATFNQVMPSLALARRIKAIRPGTHILVGGACFDGEMGREYHRVLPDILDHVFMGEAEESFREYLRRLIADKPTRGIPGVTYFDAGEVRLIPGRPLANMNQSPTPEYDDYFVEKERLMEEYDTDFVVYSLPFESSRGCWWGQKSHCTFCGLNDDLISFREKDVDRVVSELRSLSAKHRVLGFRATDFIISRKSRGPIFKKLSDLDTGIEVFYETRSDMSKEEIALMYKAGIFTIQPGIESFSTELLMHMKKAATRVRQVQFLRWCWEFRIFPGWNLLCKFPGDKAEWYLDMADFLPQIIHLPPPTHNICGIEMHRFSPLFDQRAELGVTNFRIRKDYRNNFPSGFVDLEKIGYFFEFSCSTIAPEDLYADKLRKAVSDWIEAHTKGMPIYYYTIGPGFLYLTDKRRLAGEDRFFYLEGLAKDIVLLSDKIQNIGSLKKLLAPLYPVEVAEGQIEEAVQELVEEDILMQEGVSVLTLPIGSKPRTTKELYARVLGDSSVFNAADSLSAMAA